jgi:hypothetical protein
MAYDDMNCPCGGTKMRETMLCLACETHLANHPEMRVLRDAIGYSVNLRRTAAITLLSIARRRTKAPAEFTRNSARQSITGAMLPTMAGRGAGVNVESVKLCEGSDQ